LCVCVENKIEKKTIWKKKLKGKKHFFIKLKKKRKRKKKLRKKMKYKKLKKTQDN
jgi:hypothetical protein